MPQPDPSVPKPQPSSSERQGVPTRFFTIVFIAVGLFGLLLAAGTYLSDSSPDWRKPVVVLIGTACFLGVWAILLRTRAQSHKPRNTPPNCDE